MKKFLCSIAIIGLCVTLSACSSSVKSGSTSSKNKTSSYSESSYSSSSKYEESSHKSSYSYEESSKSSKSSYSTSFTNKYGTSTTKCAHPGCDNYIASSGDTNCCTVHSNRCLNCRKYIDEDATCCIDCLTEGLSSKSSYHSESSLGYKTTTGKKKTCIACGGSGVIRQYATNDPYDPGYLMECVACHGKGYYYE